MNMPLSVNFLFYTFFTRSIITFINLFLPNGYSFGFFRHRRTAVNMVFISVSYRKIHIFFYRLFFNIHVFKRNVCFFKCILGTFMRDKMQNYRYTHHYRKQRQGKQQNNFFGQSFVFISHYLRSVSYQVPLQRWLQAHSCILKAQHCTQPLRYIFLCHRVRRNSREARFFLYP